MTTLKVIPKIYDILPESVKKNAKFYYGTILQGEQTTIVGIFILFYTCTKRKSILPLIFEIPKRPPNLKYSSKNSNIAPNIRSSETDFHVKFPGASASSVVTMSSTSSTNT